MKLSRIQQIIKEEVAKAVTEADDEFGKAMDNLKSKIGFIPASGGPENKVKETPPGYDKLPDTREDLDWNNYIQLPSLPASDVRSNLYSKKEVDEWITKFKAKYNEQPRFVETKLGIDVANSDFQEDKLSYERMKSSELEKYKSKD